MNKQGYTLQLVGARSEENIKQFIAKYGIQNDASYFKTKLSGKDWYVVVYGNYATQEQAKAAMKNLPESLATAPLQPWIVRYLLFTLILKNPPRLMNQWGQVSPQRILTNLRCGDT